MHSWRWWLRWVIVGALWLGASLPASAQMATTVASEFSRYYWRNDGPRVLGLLESVPLTRNGQTVQYFEKARLEDHREAGGDPQWAVMYGRIVAELITMAPAAAVSGTDITYGELGSLSIPQAAPPGFRSGTMPVAGGMFVPFSPDLRAAPGFVVADVFWAYMHQPTSLPGGWLHDLGLPLTPATEVVAFKADGPRVVMLQAFERGIVTYDPLNPPEWQVERANVGTDAVRAEGLEPLHVQPLPQRGARSIEIDLSEQWLYAYDGDIQVFDAPVSTGRDGFETPPGVFAIYRKYEVKTMRGEEKGERWEVPNVPHVMFFYRDFAIHGTYWHNQFGTGKRLSHGCVNLPLEAAAWLYAWAPNGTPVIVLP